MTDSVRIVVAEGSSMRRGFLRFVLDGEGYDVVGEASNPAELARSVGLHDPDVVVIDDGIGATAVGLVHDLSRTAKVVLVWPGAVMPIGGDAQVEPSNALRELGLSIERLTGVACASTLAGGAAGGRDAATLRQVLARGEAAQLHRPDTPAVIDAVGASAIAAPQSEPAAAPEPSVVETTEPTETAGATEAPGAAEDPPPGTARHRVLGTIALGGAAAAGALVLALALGGSRVPVASVSGVAAAPSTPGIGRPSATPVEPGAEPAGDVPGGWQGGAPQGLPWAGGGGVEGRNGNDAPCNYYIETCLPPAGLTGTGGLSIGDIHGPAPGAAGRWNGSRDAHDTHRRRADTSDSNTGHRRLHRAHRNDRPRKGEAA